MVYHRSTRVFFFDPPGVLEFIKKKKSSNGYLLVIIVVLMSGWDCGCGHPLSKGEDLLKNVV